VREWRKLCEYECRSFGKEWGGHISVCGGGSGKREGLCRGNRLTKGRRVVWSRKGVGCIEGVKKGTWKKTQKIGDHPGRTEDTAIGPRSKNRSRRSKKVEKVCNRRPSRASWVGPPHRRQRQEKSRPPEVREYNRSQVQYCSPVKWYAKRMRGLQQKEG